MTATGSNSSILERLLWQTFTDNPGDGDGAREAQGERPRDEEDDKNPNWVDKKMGKDPKTLREDDNK